MADIILISEKASLPEAKALKSDHVIIVSDKNASVPVSAMMLTAEKTVDIRTVDLKNPLALGFFLGQTMQSGDHVFTDDKSILAVVDGKMSPSTKKSGKKTSASDTPAPKKRHRRTKAEMEAARAAEVKKPDPADKAPAKKGSSAGGPKKDPEVKTPSASHQEAMKSVKEAAVKAIEVSENKDSISTDPDFEEEYKRQNLPIRHMKEAEGIFQKASNASEVRMMCDGLFTDLDGEIKDTLVRFLLAQKMATETE